MPSFGQVQLTDLSPFLSGEYANHLANQQLQNQIAQNQVKQGQLANTYTEALQPSQISGLIQNYNAMNQPPPAVDGAAPQAAADPASAQAVVDPASGQPMQPGQSLLVGQTPVSADAATQQLVGKVAQAAGVNPDWAMRHQYVESGSNPHAAAAHGYSGEIGAMQIMPGTADYLKIDPTNPMQNIQGGVQYLAQLKQQFGSPVLASAAYNAGPKRVQDFLDGKRPLPPSTVDYVGKVFGTNGAGLISAALSGAHGHAIPGVTPPPTPAAPVQMASNVGAAGMPPVANDAAPVDPAAPANTIPVQVPPDMAPQLASAPGQNALMPMMMAGGLPPAPQQNALAPMTAATTAPARQNAGLDARAASEVQRLIALRNIAMLTPGGAGMRAVAGIQAQLDNIAGPGGIAGSDGRVLQVPGSLATRQASANATELGKVGPEVDKARQIEAAKTAGAIATKEGEIRPATELAANTEAIKTQGAIRAHEAEQEASRAVTIQQPILDQAKESQNALNRIGQIRAAMAQATKNGLPPGYFSPALAQAAAAAKSLGLDISTLGINPAAVQNEQVAREALTQVNGEILKRMFPQRITNADVNTFGSNLANYGMDPSALEPILSQAEQAARYDVNKANQLHAYKIGHNNSAVGFESNFYPKHGYGPDLFDAVRSGTVPTTAGNGVAPASPAGQPSGAQNAPGPQAFNLQNPARPTSRAEVMALPSGTPFWNPATNSVMVKH